MIHPPLLGVVNAPSAVSARTLTCRGAGRAAELLDAVRVHGRTHSPAPQIAGARAQRVRSLDPDIACVERERIAAFDAVPLEGLEEELRHGCIAVIRIGYINASAEAHYLRVRPGSISREASRLTLMRRGPISATHAGMERDQAIARLKEHEAELRQLGIEHLYLFGSTARDEAREDSDVDLFFDHPVGSIGLYELMDVKEAASRILGRKADIMTRRSLHRVLRDRIEASALQVF